MGRIIVKAARVATLRLELLSPGRATAVVVVGVDVGDLSGAVAAKERR